MDLGLRDKTVLVTGGSSGIGQAIALAYGREPGVHIAFTYHSKGETAQQIRQAIQETGIDAQCLPLDLADATSIQAAVDTIVTKTGRIDVLVNNAIHWGNGAHRGKRVEDIPLTKWEEIIGVNLFGTIQLTQLVLPYMRQQQWGRIVNVSSDLALDSMLGSGPYSTLKAALSGFTANLVEEYSVDGILTNTVLPGWTLVERALHFFPDEFRDQARSAFPTKRITRPEDVASLVLYLGSAANGHVNGETIKVSGKGSQAVLSSLFKQHQRR